MDYLTACLLIPFWTAILCVLLWRVPAVQRLLSLFGMLSLLLAATGLVMEVNREGAVAIQFGDWPAPFGISMVADLFAAAMVWISALVGLLVAIYSIADIDQRREAFGYHAFLHFMMLGVCGAFLTGDVFNLFVWFEVMLIASFALMVLGGERGQMEGAVKYVTLNLISSGIFLAGIGILYGQTGSLNMADIAIRLQSAPDPHLVTLTAILFLVAFGVKAAIFPLFFWLPASYHTPPVAVTAAFAGLLTKVGVYALVRFFTMVFMSDVPFTHNLLLVLGIITMVTGVLGAVAQFDFRRLLAFHIVSQIGYMIFGLALLTELALAGVLIYVIHNIVAKTNLFFVSGVTRRLQGTFYLKKMGGLAKRTPFLALLFFLSAMSLGGIPPLIGFFAKFTLIKAGLAGDSHLGAGAYWGVGFALAVSMLTILSMTKIWAEAFWKEAPPETPFKPESLSRTEVWCYAIPIVILALAAVLMGFFAEPWFDYALRASQQLMDPQAYLEAVNLSRP